jgi:hypothetical protein
VPLVRTTPPSVHQVAPRRRPATCQSNHRRHTHQAVKEVLPQPLHHLKPPSPLRGLTGASSSPGMKSPSRRPGLPQSRWSALAIHRVRQWVPPPPWPCAYKPLLPRPFENHLGHRHSRCRAIKCAPRMSTNQLPSTAMHCRSGVAMGRTHPVQAGCAIQCSGPQRDCAAGLPGFRPMWSCSVFHFLNRIKYSRSSKIHTSLIWSQENVK